MTEFMKNLHSNSYFKSLPAWVQENICQTDISLSSEQELRTLAENLLKRPQQ